MRVLRSLLALVATFGLAAAPALAATHVVNVEDNVFNPAQLNVCLGDTVTWEWVGNVDHSVTSGDGCGADNGAWDSGTLSMGATFSYTFSSIPPECATDSSTGDNTCSYFCVPHCSMMDGVITVVDTPGGGIGISRNKLRVMHDPTEGRGGTTLGVETLDGALFANVVPGTTMLTMTLSGPGLGAPISSTVPLAASRSGWSTRLPADNALQLNIRSASISVTEPDIAKLKIGWATNGFDLNAAGTLTLTVDVEHDVTRPCGGTATVVASGSAVVQK
jgi:plastocyanin